jgi:thiamine-monophosphate kinase
VTTDASLVIELGERAALAKAVAHFKRGANTKVGSGDDAAVVGLASVEFVVTTDTMIEGHDFRHDLSSGYDLGYKAVATNVADVYAMGARPIALVVAMTVTESTTITWLEDFARGLQAGIDDLAPESEVVGGDLGFGPVTMIAVTAHGDLELRQPILRSGARVGDQLAVCGTLGKAAAGLDLLLHEDKTLAASYPELAEVQLRPTPPVQAVQGGFATATSMLDISDSLALDASRIASASKVKLVIDPGQLLGFEAVLEQAAQSLAARGGNASAMDWVLYGGEDHGFLATFPPGGLPRGFKLIGEVQEGSGVFLGESELKPRGWDSVRREAQS